MVVLLWLALLSCGCKAPEPIQAGLVFGSLVEQPVAGAPGVVAAVRQVHWNGVSHAVTFHPLATTGEATYGELVDAAGSPIGDDDGPWVCNAADFASLLEVDDQWFHVSHLECTLGGLELIPVTPTGDTLVPAAPIHADLSAVGGVHVPCSGDATPWNTHLASEEYEPDARKAQGWALPASEMSMASKHPYEWSFHNLHAAYTPEPSPYRYGWIPELTILDATGRNAVAKHYAMGRFSHELALVLPDRRTVYLSDDQHHGAFFLFVADTAQDLSAGRLYASRWSHTPDGFALEWVPLGHATNARIAAALDSGVVFDDLFETAPVDACPDGFAVVTTTWGAECLRAKDAVLASRLESRRYAALRGATTELNKNEGLAFDPDAKRLYLAASSIDAGMLEEQSQSRGPGDYRRGPEQDHVRMAPNPCGVVFGMSPGQAVDTEGRPMDSDLVMRTASEALTGRPKGKACADDAIANPDNLTWIDDHGLLVVAEDTPLHTRDTLWAHDPAAGTLVPLLQVDPRSEVTGVHWFGDVEGSGWLTVSNQWSPSDWPEDRSVAGVLGPFPRPQ